MAATVEMRRRVVTASRQDVNQLGRIATVSKTSRSPVNRLVLETQGGAALFDHEAALSPTWKRTKRRIVISSPNCLATEPTCSLTETSEFFFTKP